MMDRTIPWISLAMQMEALKAAPVFELPEGYGWRMYQSGDECLWAEIEASAGEFPDAGTALEKFRRVFPMDGRLNERMLFLTEKGKPFATATAWFSDENAREGRLHWVAVDAPHQRRGLSYPLVSLALCRMLALGHSSAYLTTQTASWLAIKVYHRFGFVPMLRNKEEIEGWRIVSAKTRIRFTEML